MNREAQAERLLSLARTLQHLAEGPASNVEPLAVISACQEVSEEIAAVRDDTAVSLADAGLTFAEVGECLGISRQRAHQLVQRARARRQAEWGHADIPEVREPRSDFADYCTAMLGHAEKACNGYLVSRRGEREAVDGRGFYTPHGRRLPARWASDELLEHWAAVGRPMTWQQWQAGSVDRREAAQVA